jgi:glycosyltransferase involved in cell wall biosynthesis
MRSVRLLVLVAYPPSSEAPHGGSRVAAQLIGRLAEANRVALVCLRGPDEPAVDASIAERCERVIEVERPLLGPRHARFRRLAGLATGKPSWVVDSDVQKCDAELNALLDEWQPELVHVHYQVMGQYLSALRNQPVPRVLVVYEPATGRAAAAVAEAPAGGRRLLRHADFLAWRRYERRLLRHVQAVAVFTERDREELSRLGTATPISVIPFGVEPPARALDPLGSGQDVVLFLGNFVHRPNVDAASWLGGTIFPRLRALHPQATLELVGPEPPPELRALEGGGVVVTGAVADVGPYLDRANVFVAPIRTGGGMRLKVLEALAAGKAVVASQLAAEGLDVRDREELLLADTEDEVVEAVSLLLSDPARRRAVAGRARRYALDRLGWERALTAYANLHASLLSASATERDHHRVSSEAAGAEAAAAPPSVPAAPEDVEEPR